MNGIDVAAIIQRRLERHGIEHVDCEILAFDIAMEIVKVRELEDQGVPNEEIQGVLARELARDALVIEARLAALQREDVTT